MWFVLEEPLSPGFALFFGSRSGFADTARVMLPLPVLESAATAEEESGASTLSLDNSQAPPSFEEVYNDNFAFVWRVVRRQGVAPEHIDDVCQEVFIIVHRKLPDFEQRAKVRTWIYQIVTNVVRNQRRSHQRKSVHARAQGEVLDPDELVGSEGNPEHKTGRRQAAAAAREILMEMNEKQRMAFVLIELEGMSIREVAEATEESFHTIRSRLRTARSEFQRHARRLQNVAEWGSRG